jgi:hypothetical protein
MAVTQYHIKMKASELIELNEGFLCGFLLSIGFLLYEVYRVYRHRLAHVTKPRNERIIIG